MGRSFQSSTCVLAVLVLMVRIFLPPDVMAQDHVVSSAELRKDLTTAAQVRQDNRAKVVRFFSSDQAKGALQSASLSGERILKAVPQLGDDELIRLTSLTDKFERDFAAGALNNQEITYILIALGTAVIVLVLVK
jgi:hypothetical protein